MSFPEPPISLDGSCSVVHGNTLYSYSPNGFLSIDLEGGASWTQLEMGKKVTGATCTGTTPTDDSKAAFFVVGGKADSGNYSGLQKFTYSTGEWTTITPSDLVTQNRIGHGSVYIEDYDVLMVYAGSQEGTPGLSSQTFTINASEPYSVRSYESDSPISIPILLPWSSDDAAILSGDGTSGEIYLFNPVQKWRHSGASLARPVDKVDGWMDAVLTTATDGSRSIYTFDLSQSPNQVSRAVVQDASGKPVPNAVAVSKRDVADQALGSLDQRDLTLDNWPAYNATMAPIAIRKDFSVAQGSNGLAVISGGSAKDSVALFYAENNQWLNATDVFLAPKGKQAVQQVLANSLSPTSTTSSQSTTSPATTSSTATSSNPTMIPTPAITSTPTDLAVPPMHIATKGDSERTPNEILGITLGTIAGFLALLGLIAFIMSLRRRRRLKKSSLRNKRIGSPMAIEKERDFQSDLERSPPPNYSASHSHQASQDSASSTAMILGGAGQKVAKKTADNPRVTSPTLAKMSKAAISKPIAIHKGDSRSEMGSETGKPSKPATAYPQGILKNPAPLAPSAQAPAGPGGSNHGTRRSSGWNGYWSSGGALSILGVGGASRDTQLSVGPSSTYSGTQGSHAESHESAKVPPLVVHSPRATSKSPVVSTHMGNVPWKEGLSVSIENRPYSAVSSLYSSGVPESVHEAWDPSLPKKAWGSDRAPSAAYGRSAGNLLAVPSTGISKQPQLARATTSTDMSWLNLGEEDKH